VLAFDFLAIISFYIIIMYSALSLDEAPLIDGILILYIFFKEIEIYFLFLFFSDINTCINMPFSVFYWYVLYNKIANESETRVFN